MNALITRIHAVIVLTGLATLLPQDTLAQTTVGNSGVPGDGMPDIYYFASSATISTTDGPQTRPAGYLTLDTDGQQFVAMLLSDTEEFFFDGCILCDGGSLPDPLINPPLRFYTVGHLNDATQWIATFPLVGGGPIGVFDLAQGPSGLTDVYFEEILQDPFQEGWSVQFVTDRAGQFFTNVTVVPEPSTCWLVMVGFCVCGGSLSRRRQPRA